MGLRLCRSEPVDPIEDHRRVRAGQYAQSARSKASWGEISWDAVCREVWSAIARTRPDGGPDDGGTGPTPSLLPPWFVACSRCRPSESRTVLLPGAAVVDMTSARSPQPVAYAQTRARPGVRMPARRRTTTNRRRAAVPVLSPVQGTAPVGRLPLDEAAAIPLHDRLSREGRDRFATTSKVGRRWSAPRDARRPGSTVGTWWPLQAVPGLRCS